MSRISANENFTYMVIDFVRGVAHTFYMSQDGFCETHINTIEGVWTTVRNFLRPFRGVHKKFLAGYVAICEFAINIKSVTVEFISKLVQRTKS